MARLAGYTPFEGYAVEKYVISPEGICFGREALEKALTEKCDLVVIDEVGPLELQGDGLSESVKTCLSLAPNLVVVVRSSLVNAFLGYFGHHLFQEALIVESEVCIVNGG